jgi:hypothetical protein
MISPERFKVDIKRIAAEMKVAPREIHIRSMKKKWASCSRKGRLTFNNSLLQRPARFRREVVVHELLHLTFPNHGKMFKVLQRSYLRPRD